MFESPKIWLMSPMLVIVYFTMAIVMIRTVSAIFKSTNWFLIFTGFWLWPVWIVIGTYVAVVFIAGNIFTLLPLLALYLPSRICRLKDKKIDIEVYTKSFAVCLVLVNGIFALGAPPFISLYIEDDPTTEITPWCGGWFAGIGLCIATSIIFIAILTDGDFYVSLKNSIENFLEKRKKKAQQPSSPPLPPPPTSTEATYGEPCEICGNFKEVSFVPGITNHNFCAICYRERPY